MTLKTNNNGTYTVTSKADAVKALEMMQERSDEAKALMKEHGIDELMQEATELKKAATVFCVTKEIDRLDLDDQYALLRRDGYDRHWIADNDDLVARDTPDGAISLRTIIGKRYGQFAKGAPATKIWQRITKRVVDPDALQEVVDGGELAEDEIAPAFVEKQKSPYLRLYAKGD